MLYLSKHVSMPKITNYFQELKRRKVFTSLGLYMVSSFIIMQVVAIIVPTLMLPEWTDRLILTLLLLGFPIVIIFAWIYDRTPNGFVKTDSTETEPNTIDESEFPRDKKGNSTIVYIDILNYSKLMNQDEKKAIDLVHYKHKIILPFIEKYGGFFINRLGDGTLCAFPNPAKAVCFSLEILQMWKEISPTKLKIGIHLDHVVFEQGDVLGKGINCTFRINALAKAGGICISKAVADEVQSRPDIHTTSMGDIALEGFTETYKLFSVDIPEKFVSMDTDLNISSAQEISQNKASYSSIAVWSGAVLIIIFILFEGVKLYNKPTAIANSISVAVFPFDNISESQDYNWLTNGLARTLTFKLSEINNLSVIDQVQVLKAIEKVEPQQASVAYNIVARRAAETMDINLLLLGSFQIFGDEIQVTTNLVESKSGKIIPLIMESYSITNPITMQKEVAEKIITSIKLKTDKEK